MSASDAAALQELVTGLSALPSNVNPYPILMEKLFSIAVPMPEPYLEHAMQANYVISSIGLLVSLAVVGLKLTNRGGWIYRIKQTPDGPLMTPNTTFLLSCLSVFFFSISIPTIKFILDSFIDRRSPVPYQAMQGVLWFAVASLNWVEFWGMCVSTYLSRNTARQHSKFETSVKGFFPRIPTYVPNTIALVFPPAYFVLVISLFAYATSCLRHAMEAYHELEAQVEIASAGWTTGQPFAFNLSWTANLSAYTEGLHDALDWVGNGFLCHTIAILFALLCFAPTSIFYLRMIRSQMRLYSRAVKQRTSSLHLDSSSKEVRSLRTTYRLMAAETVLVALFSTYYLGLGFWVSIDTQNVIARSDHVCFLWAASFTVLGALATITVSVILYRTVKSVMTNRMARQRTQGGLEASVGGIHIHTEVQVHIDDDDMPFQYFMAGYREPTKEQQSALQMTPTPKLVNFVRDDSKAESEEK